MSGFTADTSTTVADGAAEPGTITDTTAGIGRTAAGVSSSGHLDRSTQRYVIYDFAQVVLAVTFHTPPIFASLRSTCFVIESMVNVSRIGVTVPSVS